LHAFYSFLDEKIDGTDLQGEVSNVAEHWMNGSLSEATNKTEYEGLKQILKIVKKKRQ